MLAARKVSSVNVDGRWVDGCLPAAQRTMSEEAEILWPGYRSNSEPRLLYDLGEADLPLWFLFAHLYLYFNLRERERK